MSKEMQEKLGMLTVLIKLAKVDEKEQDMEYDFLLILAERLGVDKERFDQLFTDYIEHSPPPLESDRILQFHRLVLLMNVDGESHKSEKRFLQMAGVVMGLNPVAVTSILEEMERYENKVIPPERLIEIFKVHHN